MGLGDWLNDAQLAQTINLRRFSEWEEQRVAALLNELGGEIAGKLQGSGINVPGTNTERERGIRQLFAQTKGLIGDSYDEIQAWFNDDLVQVAASEGDLFRSVMNSTGVTLVDTPLPQPEILRRLVDDTMIQGAPSAEWWGRQSETLRNSFQDEIRLGMASGEGIDDMVRRIRGTATGRRSWYEDPRTGNLRQYVEFSGGIMDTSTRNARALVRTSVMSVAAEARRDQYRANADVVKGLEQVSTLDGKTTEVCILYDGEKWYFEEQDIAEGIGAANTTATQAPSGPAKGKERPIRTTEKGGRKSWAPTNEERKQWADLRDQHPLPKQFKNSKEFDDWAKNRFPDTKFDKFPKTAGPAELMETGRALDDFERKFPKQMRDLKRFKLAPDETGAWWDPETGSLEFERSMFRKGGLSNTPCTEDSVTGWLGDGEHKDSLYGFVSHELGHVLETSLEQSGSQFPQSVYDSFSNSEVFFGQDPWYYGRALAPNEAKMFRDSYKLDVADGGTLPIPQMSGYGGSDYEGHELWAESFSWWSWNQVHPGEVPPGMAQYGEVDMSWMEDFAAKMEALLRELE